MIKSLRFRTGAILLLGSITCLAQSEVGYKVSIQPEAATLQVEMTFPVASDTVSVSMPNWAPGAYMLTYPARQIKNMEVTDKAGESHLPIGDTDNTWQITGIKGGALTLKYTLPARANDQAFHFSGPSTYLYVVGRKEETCKLTVDVPESWDVFCGLDEVKGMSHVFTAPNYDVLADNPVSTGDPSNLISASYQVSGIPHQFVLMGESRKDVDVDHLSDLCYQISSSQTDMFGEIPYRKYVWHFFVSDQKDGGWGLEHLSSTEIGLASGLGPGITSVLSHEFFHLWNVKRIRSKPLGPFDYNVLPKTGALWWLEGVTDYYADYLLYRYQWFPVTNLYSSVASNWSTVINNPAYSKISPFDSSYRVGEANNGQGNSQGLDISYYNLGWLVGLCLDIEIRSLTEGRKCLDDVMLALNDLTKNGQPGFEEDEIRTQCIRIGGPEMGPYYDRIVMTPGNLPVSSELEKVGLVLSEKQESYTDTGFTASPSKADGGARVRNVSGPAVGQLQRGDIIVKIGDVVLDGNTNSAIAESLAKAVAAMVPGSPVTLSIKREASQIEASITPVAANRKVYSVQESPNATASAVMLRNGWLATKPKPKR